MNKEEERAVDIVYNIIMNASKEDRNITLSAIYCQEQIIDKLKEYGIISEFENEVLNKLKSYEK